jgi:hypothetical protein
MKLIHFIITAIQVTIASLYILFYNLQYFWSLYASVNNLLNALVK